MKSDQGFSLGTRLSVAFMSIIVISLIFTAQSHAKIDPESIVGAWLFDDGKGKVAADASKGGHDGNLEKSPMWVPGRFDTALEFNGGNYVELDGSAEDLPFGGVEPFTIGAWVNPQAGGTVIGKFNGGVIGAYILIVQGGGGVTFHREVAPWGLASNQTTVPVGKFTHIAATYDGAEMKIYIDGDEVATQARGAQNTDLATPVLIGARFTQGQPSDFFTGIIDEVVLFNVALDKGDVKTLMGGLQTILGLAVEPGNKLATTWATLKTQQN